MSEGTVKPISNLSKHPEISTAMLRDFCSKKQSNFDFVRDSDSQSESERETPRPKPEHISARSRLLCLNRPSLLSTSGNNYQGFMNLAILALIVSHLRLMYVNIIQYGLLLSNPINFVSVIIGNPNRWPMLSLFICYNIWILVAFLLEKLAANAYSRARIQYQHKEDGSKKKHQKTLKGGRFITSLWLEGFVLATHLVLWGSLMFSTIYLIHTQQTHPVTGIAIMFLMTILLMKLMSYALINRSLRKHAHARKPVYTAYAVQYPANITLKDIYYFIAAPTLVYEENFPRTSGIRWKFLGKLVLEFIFVCFTMLFIIEQYMVPLVQHAMTPLRSNDMIGIIERILKLTIPNIVLWLFLFYSCFHLLLNIIGIPKQCYLTTTIGEILMFGDRLFYLDWWNATSLDYFWRTWNLPVHKWLIIHVYFPLTKRGFSPAIASLMTFVWSAIFHEMIISVPFHTFKAWAFSAMMVQMPLCFLTRKYTRGKQYGNMLFWLSFMIGQANCIIMYYNDFTLQNK